ncbi:MAG: hypothetical protein AAGG80_01505 [Pseudomonadota bacterium]
MEFKLKIKKEKQMDMRPCPICETSMTIRTVGSQAQTDMPDPSYFIYCRQCGYGPIETFMSAQQAADHWEEHALKSGAESY